jgi:hypothetical protein
MAETDGQRRYRERKEREQASARREGELLERERQLQRREQTGSRSRSRPGKSGGGGKLRLPGDPSKVLVASETVALVSTTAYGFLGPQDGQQQKLPDPRQIVAALAFYAVLGLVGSFGRGASTAAGWVGAIMALTLLVTGKTGKGMLLLVEQLARMTRAPAGSAPTSGTGGG